MENYMSYGHSTFGIKDDELYKNWNSKFIKFLNKEGFKNWEIKGYYCGNVLFINMNSKRYAFSIPGIKITEHIAHKYITIKEFKKIYKILKKEGE